MGQRERLAQADKGRSPTVRPRVQVLVAGAGRRRRTDEVVARGPGGPKSGEPVDVLIGGRVGVVGHEVRAGRRRRGGLLAVAARGRRRQEVGRDEVDDLVDRVDVLGRGRADVDEVPVEVARRAVEHDLAAREEEETVEEREGFVGRLVDRADDEHALLVGETLYCEECEAESVGGAARGGEERVGVRERTEGHDLLAALGVEPARRLVEDENPRLGDDRAGDGDAALLPARDAALQGRADALVGDRREAERGEGRVDVLRQVGVRRPEAASGRGESQGPERAGARRRRGRTRAEQRT